jgi:hypothetical protein
MSGKFQTLEIHDSGNADQKEFSSKSLMETKNHVPFAELFDIAIVTTLARLGGTIRLYFVIGRRGQCSHMDTVTLHCT